MQEHHKSEARSQTKAEETLNTFEYQIISYIKQVFVEKLVSWLLVFIFNRGSRMVLVI